MLCLFLRLSSIGLRWWLRLWCSVTQQKLTHKDSAREAWQGQPLQPQQTDDKPESEQKPSEAEENAAKVTKDTYLTAPLPSALSTDAFGWLVRVVVLWPSGEICLDFFEILKKFKFRFLFLK